MTARLWRITAWTVFEDEGKYTSEQRVCGQQKKPAMNSLHY
ncbi:MAG TPA: hypothetical protein VLG72_05560 [Nitrospirota bacterium]|nr:hypothetical protein [Nitrospirota bacterium]